MRSTFLKWSYSLQENWSYFISWHSTYRKQQSKNWRGIFTERKQQERDQMSIFNTQSFPAPCNFLGQLRVTEQHCAAPSWKRETQPPDSPWQSKEGWESLNEPAQEVEIPCNEVWPDMLYLLPFSPLLLAHCDIQAISLTIHQHAVACTPLPTASPYTPQQAAVIAFPISPQRQQLPWQPAMILISLVCFQGQHTRAGTWARCRHAPRGRRTCHQIQRHSSKHTWIRETVDEQTFTPLHCRRSGCPLTSKAMCMWETLTVAWWY